MDKNRLKGVVSFLFLLVLLFTIDIKAQFYIPAINFSDTISLTFVGDLMCHSPQFDYTRVKKDSFNFKPVFRYIKNELTTSDLTAGNLETVLGGKSEKYTGYPKFNSPDDYLFALKDAGFNFLFTSNNHALDRGENGITRTIKLLDSLGINHTGTYLSQEDRDSIRIVNIKDVHIALLSYSYGSNGIKIPDGKDYLINVINDSLIRNDIDNAKLKAADLVICYFHFGEEYKRLPDKAQLEIVDSTISYGADIIIASHPHVIQPYIFYQDTNSKLDSVLVAFSLGNFISNQRKRYTDAGMILKIVLIKNYITGQISYEKVSYCPTWVFKGTTERGKEFLVLNSETAGLDSTISFLTKNDLIKLNQSLVDTKAFLNRYQNVNALKMLGKKKLQKSAVNRSSSK